MNSLTYLFITTMKNRFKEMIKKPGKLIAYILGIGFMVFLFITAIFTDMPDDPMGLYALKGIFFGFFLMNFFATAISGLKGASNYCMEDVNLLFVSPIRARTILLYGIVQSAKTILFGSWIVFFQASWFRSAFGIDIGGVFLIWAGYVVFSLSCQMLSIFLYAMTNDNENRKNIAKVILTAVFAPVIIAAVYYLSQAGGEFMPALQMLTASPVFDYTPFVGWASVGTLALVTGEAAVAVLFLGLLVASVIVMVAIVCIADPDYYEHVSGATQTAFETIRSMQEGDLQNTTAAGREKVKIKGTGLSGEGSEVFFRKHIRESFRAHRFGLWGVTSFLYVAGAAIYAFFLRNGNGEASVAGWEIITIIMTVFFIKIFSIGNSRGMLETYSHYIYMVPENPFRKWIWANMEVLFKEAVEGVFIFGVAGFILGVPVSAIVLSVFVYMMFVFYLLGSSLAFMRVTGIASKSMWLGMLMLFIQMTPLIPGLVLVIFVVMLLPEAIAFLIGALIFSVWQLLLGIGCFAFSKSVLHNCDMPSVNVDYLIS